MPNLNNSFVLPGERQDGKCQAESADVRIDTLVLDVYNWMPHNVSIGRWIGHQG